MKIKVRTEESTLLVPCYGTFYVNFGGIEVLFAFTDDIRKIDSLRVTEYKTGMSFPVDMGEPSGETLGLDTPMSDEDPYFAMLVIKANRLIDETLATRGIGRERMLELVEMNQRKYQTNEVDF